MPNLLSNFLFKNFVYFPAAGSIIINSLNISYLAISELETEDTQLLRAMFPLRAASPIHHDYERIRKARRSLPVDIGLSFAQTGRFPLVTPNNPLDGLKWAVTNWVCECYCSGGVVFFRGKTDKKWSIPCFYIVYQWLKSDISYNVHLIVLFRVEQAATSTTTTACSPHLARRPLLPLRTHLPDLPNLALRWNLSQCHPCEQWGWGNAALPAHHW